MLQQLLIQKDSDGVLCLTSPLLARAAEVIE
jgi:hypothetical protein